MSCAFSKNFDVLNLCYYYLCRVWTHI